MKIIKRNGSEAVFDISKIMMAVSRANEVVQANQKLSKAQINAIAAQVEEVCSTRPHAMNVEDIQDLVENQIMEQQAFEVARRRLWRHMKRELSISTIQIILPSTCITAISSTWRICCRTER